MTSRPLRIILVLLAAALAFGAVFCFAFTPLTMSQDEWWHLKTGKWIWEHGMRPPVNDVFAYTSSDLCWNNPKPYRWDNHEWFAEVVMFLAYRAGEKSGFGPMRAVIALKTAVWLAAFGLVFLAAWRRGGHVALALLLTVAAAAASRFTAQPRPPIVTYFFIAFFQIALVAYRQGRIRPIFLLALPVLMAGWANLHGGFILGGIAIACFFAGEAAEFLWKRFIRPGRDGDRGQAAWRRGWVLFGIGVLCGLASLATPFGWRLYLLTFRVMSDKALTQLISELQPPKWKFVWAYIGLIASAGAFGLLNWRRLSAGETLWVVFLLHQSANHMRHMPLFAIAAAPFIAEHASSLWAWLERKPRWLVKGVEYGLLGWTVAASVFWMTARRLPPLFDRPRLESYLDRAVDLARGRAYSVNSYPVRLADFVEDAGFHGRMFNDSRYAGYLIWRFSPEKFQVFTDMRYDIFGGDFFVEDLAGREGGEYVISAGDSAPAGTAPRRVDWKTVYEKWNVNFTVIDRLTAQEDTQRPLLPEIEASNNWTRVYQDPGDRGLVIFLRNTPENANLLARCRRLAPMGLYERPGREPCGR